MVTPGRDFEPLSYRVDEFGAYFRLLAGQMETFLGDPASTYPERVSHCDYCTWWPDCEKRRRGDDHLCYVAGISRGQIESLRELGVERLENLAVLDPVPEPFFGYERDQDLREASQSMRLVESAVANGSLETNDPHSRIVEDYNREDCESTLRLRDWLEELRADVVSKGHAIPRRAARSFATS